MKNDSLLGPWIRRFLLEHLVAERNLSRNTQCSYRDTLWLLLPRLALRGQLSMFWRSRIYPPTAKLPRGHRRRAWLQRRNSQPEVVSHTRPRPLYRPAQS
jgi:hypothetical protein